MNVDLVNRIAETVTPDDELWLLGDVAMGNVQETIHIIERFPCPVVFVAGNHDRCHPYRGPKHKQWTSVYENLSNVTRLILTDTRLVLADGTTVNVSHFPYATPGADKRADVHDKFETWRVPDNGDWMICGHVHQNWRTRAKMVNVGVDAWNGYPVSEDTIISLIADGPANRDALPWTMNSQPVS